MGTRQRAPLAETLQTLRASESHFLDIKKFSHLQAIEFKTDALDILRGPGVYMFCEGDRALYIGASRKVIGRILARNHKLLSINILQASLHKPRLIRYLTTCRLSAA